MQVNYFYVIKLMLNKKGIFVLYAYYILNDFIFLPSLLIVILVVSEFSVIFSLRVMLELFMGFHNNF